ncbi:MAG: glycosyltransferase family 8 protein [Candidatus Xenobiia bacterium LiM19]
MKVEESEMTPILIIAAVDENYAQHMAVMMASVLANNSSCSPVEFNIIDGGISADSRNRIDALREHYDVAIHYLKIDTHMFDKFPTVGYLSRAGYYRLMISDLVNPSVEKTLYLDSDLIVRADLRELWETDLGGSCLAAVQDVDGDRKKDLGIPSSAKYFNSGVMLMNLVKWREYRLSQQILEYISKHPSTRSCDQDPSNIALYDKWHELHPRWNVQTLMINGEAVYRNTDFNPNDLQAAISQPAIIHYTDAPKPWQYKSLHPFTDEYYHYLEMTGWKGYQPAVPQFQTSYGKLPFIDREKGRIFRLAGWYPPEKHFVWTRGKESLIIAGQLPAPLQTIHLRCNPFTAFKQKGQRVKITVGKESVGEFFVDRKMELRFPVPNLSSEPTVVRLLLPDAASPYKLGLSEDVRTLALAVHSLEIVPLQKHH